jgi:O-antigen ligase
MVQENVTWFSLKSATYVGRPVDVIAGSATRTFCPGQSSFLRDGRRAGPAALLRTLSQPPRSQLWLAALRMLRRHPLLGIGPDGFRFHFGTYVAPPMKTWDVRILANELYLEQLADFGLLGTALYLAFLAAVWWPLLAPLARGRQQGSAIWQIGLLAALAAYLSHGLVDVFLDSHAISTLLWLLCGLASTLGSQRVHEESG